MTIKKATITIEHVDGNVETIEMNNEENRTIELNVSSDGNGWFRYTKRTPEPIGKPYTRLKFSRPRTQRNPLSELPWSRGFAEFEVPRDQAEEAIRQAVAQGWQIRELTHFMKP